MSETKKRYENRETRPYKQYNKLLIIRLQKEGINKELEQLLTSYQLTTLRDYTEKQSTKCNSHSEPNNTLKEKR